MLGNAFGWPHLLIILAIVLLFFGAPKLPGLARSVGQSMRIFKGEMKTMKSDDQAKRDEAEARKNDDAVAPKSASDVRAADVRGSDVRADDSVDGPGSETRPKP